MWNRSRVTSTQIRNSRFAILLSGQDPSRRGKHHPTMSPLSLAYVGPNPNCHSLSFRVDSHRSCSINRCFRHPPGPGTSLPATRDPSSPDRGGSWDEVVGPTLRIGVPGSTVGVLSTVLPLPLSFCPSPDTWSQGRPSGDLDDA